MILVVLTPSIGLITRWEGGGETPRLTHRASAEQPVEFDAATVLKMRLYPPAEFAAWQRDTPIPDLVA